MMVCHPNRVRTQCPWVGPDETPGTYYLERGSSGPTGCP